MTAVADYEEFFSDNYSQVVRALTVALGDTQRAEDAAQVGFEQAFRKWRTVGEMARPSTWVYVVAVRQQRRWLRDDRRRPAADGMREGPDPSEAGVTAASLREALAALTPRQRTAVVLRHVGDLDLADTAEAMGVAVGTVKATLHAAYRRLRVNDADLMEDSDAAR